MAYSTYGETYDPYTMARSMSRGQSYGYPGSNYSGYSAGYPGSYPGTPYPGQASMYQDGSEYSQYQQPYSSYGGVPSSAISRRVTGQGHGYDDDPYYGNQQLALSSSMGGPRQRRHSTVSFAARPPGLDAYRSPSALHLKFKRKGSFTSGIGLDEAQSTHIRLSGNDAYTFHDLHADGRKRIHLRVKWTGYSSLTYEIPLDGYDGRVDLQTLARRVSRACVHYLQANVIPILWDRVILHHLEEVSYGVWQPMLSTR